MWCNWYMGSVFHADSGQCNGASLTLREGVFASPTWSLKVATDQARNKLSWHCKIQMDFIWNSLVMRCGGHVPSRTNQYLDKHFSLKSQWINTIQSWRQDTSNIRKPMATDGYSIWDNGSSEVPLKITCQNWQTSWGGRNDKKMAKPHWHQASMVAKLYTSTRYWTSFAWTNTSNTQLHNLCKLYSSAYQHVVLLCFFVKMMISLCWIHFWAVKTCVNHCSNPWFESFYQILGPQTHRILIQVSNLILMMADKYWQYCRECFKIVDDKWCWSRLMVHLIY